MDGQAARRRAESLYELAHKALIGGDYASLARIGDNIVELGHEAGDQLIVARGEVIRGNAALQSGDGRTAEDAYKRALPIFEALGENDRAATTLMNLGIVAADIDLDIERAIALKHRGLELMTDRAGRAYALALGNLGEACRMAGDFVAAIRYAAQSRELFLANGDTLAAAWQSVNLAHYYSLQRNFTQALETLRSSYERLCGGENPAWLSLYFEVWLFIAVDLKYWAKGAQLWGFVEAYRSHTGVPRLHGMLPWYVAATDRLRKELQTPEFNDLQEAGARLSVTQAHQITNSVSLN